MNVSCVEQKELSNISLIMAPNRIDFVPCQVHPISRPLGSSASSARPTPYPAARIAVRRSLFSKPERGEIDNLLATETQRQKDEFFEKYNFIDVRPQESKAIAVDNIAKKEMPTLIAKELKQYEERPQSKIYQLETKITQIENVKSKSKTNQLKLNIISSDCRLRSGNATCIVDSAAAVKVAEGRGSASGGDANKRCKQKRITEFLPKCKSIPPP